MPKHFSFWKTWRFSKIMTIVLCRPCIQLWRLKGIGKRWKTNWRADVEPTNLSNAEYLTETHSCLPGYSDKCSSFEQFLHCEVGALLNLRVPFFSTSSSLEHIDTTVYRLNPIRRKDQWGISVSQSTRLRLSYFQELFDSVQIQGPQFTCVKCFIIPRALHPCTLYYSSSL